MSDQAMARIGCQGWNYADWISPPAARAPVFYPHGTRATDMLTLYARVFSTVEVDSTFYAIPKSATFDNWAARTPSGFTFALKLPQEITHRRELRDCAALLSEFCAGARRLKEKLAAVLVQLPPHFVGTPESERALAAFLKELPDDIHFAVEFRGNAWLDDATFDLLMQNGVSLALVEGQWLNRRRVFELAEKLTTDFAYLRWMGARDLTRFDHVQRRQDENLKSWSKLIASLSRRIPRIYGYFSNYYEGHAPASANKLKHLLGQKIVEAKEIEDQPSLF